MSKTFVISMPSDGKGFIGRACDSPGCSQYFKIRIPDHKENLFCPYCGSSFPKEALLTRDQLDHLRRASAEELKIIAFDEFQRVFAGAFRGSKNVTFKPGPRPTKRPVIPSYSEREVDTELECSECGTQFQVYGIFGYCPGCRCENLHIYDANWAIIKRGMESAEDKERQLRHAYGDLISTFELFCSRKARKLTSETANFQDLFDARKFFRDHANVDILASLPQDSLLSLRRVFQKRHVSTHAGGMITERYIRMIPEDARLLGTKALLAESELEEAGKAVRIALGELVRHMERPGK
jgi:hypothetical protein